MYFKYSEFLKLNALRRVVVLKLRANYLHLCLFTDKQAGQFPDLYENTTNPIDFIVAKLLTDNNL